MKRVRVVIGITVVLFTTALLAGYNIVNATSSYLSQFNSRYSASGTALNTCSVCHTSAPATNPYGTAFRSNSHNFATIEPLDSDGDSYTNIVEINARTFPGDAASRPASQSDRTLPTVTAFTIPATSSSLTVSITSFTASDNVGVAGYLVNTSFAKPLASAAGWSTTRPASYTAASAGTKILYAWAKDAAGNVSMSRTAVVIITVAPSTDTTLPAVNAFSIPSTSASLTVSITSFTASDNVGVTGYMVNESTTKPSASAAGWSATAPASYTAASAGAKTLYAWAKDAAGNVSASRSALGDNNSTLLHPEATTLLRYGRERSHAGSVMHSRQRGARFRSLSVAGTGALCHQRTLIQGKLNTAVNSYCVNILGNWNVCGNCHAGLGAKPEATATAAQLANIDCLVCHQKDYKRKKVNGVFVPDTANMTITMDQAVQTVHKPVRANCLQCHAKAGGGDNNKRGDIALAHANTTDRNFDVHMATTGANLTCQSCHTTQNHKIAGRGSDLRETDLDVAVTCTNCHTNKLSSTGSRNCGR